MFMFGSCRRSLAAEAAAIYECDSKVSPGTLTRSKIILIEKLTMGALETPTLGLYLIF